jgi:hypothetical protein
MLHLNLRHNIMVILVLCIGTGLCICPCQAGIQYYSGGPDLFASLSSSDELIPGSTGVLPLLIENKGTVTMEFYNVNTLQTDYLPTTALFSTVRLLPGDAPVRVKTNPQILGDIPAGAAVPSDFTVEIPQDARAGNYTMQAVVTYQYVPWVQQSQSSQIEYTFKNAEKVIPVPVVIRRMVILSVKNTSGSHVNAGGEGYLTFTIKNTGQDTGRRTSVYFSPEGASPIVPYDNGVYIGELSPGGTAQPRFKVAVSRDADPSVSYPVTLYAVYRDFEGNSATSPPVSTGVTVGEKVHFTLVSTPSAIRPGKTDIVSATYKNTGNTTVYNAQARISVVDPFSSDDETAYLGDMKPGQSAVALFSINTASGATIKTYSVDSEIQYTDSTNTAFTSDNIPVILDVNPSSGIGQVLIILLLVIVAALSCLWYWKKRAQT